MDERDRRKGGQKEEWTRIVDNVSLTYRRSLYAVSQKTRIANLGKSADFRNIK